MTECNAGCNPTLIGELKGKLDLVLVGQETQTKKLDALDSRIRHVENRSAIMGAAGALIVAIGLEIGRIFLRKN